MSEKIGFILGGGKIAEIAVKGALKEGYSVFVAGFDGITDRKIADLGVSGLVFLRLGQVGGVIDFLKKNGVKKVILIGKVSHINVFRDLRPDVRGAIFLMKLKDRTPYGIFSAVESELKKEGIEIENSAKFLKDSIIKEGVLTGRVSDDDLDQIRYGFNIAKNIAAMDIGLTVIVKDYCVIAVEAVEGTDECIKRAGSLCLKKCGFIMVKVARPNQDMRFDLPVIGPDTVKNVYDSGGKIIACESGKTVVVDMEHTIEIAKEKKITIYGIRGEDDKSKS